MWIEIIAGAIVVFAVAVLIVHYFDEPFDVI